VKPGNFLFSGGLCWNRHQTLRTVAERTCSITGWVEGFSVVRVEYPCCKMRGTRSVSDLGSFWILEYLFVCVCIYIYI
jgi:hypothetical protein